VSDPRDRRDLREVEAPLADRPGGVGGLLRRAAIDIGPLRTSRQFRRLWVGQSISLIGSHISWVAIPYQVYQLTGSTLAVGLVALCDLIPLLLFAVVGGAIADAVERRRLLLLTEIGLVIVTAGLAVNAALTEPQVWPLYVIAFLATSLWAIGSPALRSLTPRLVPADQFAAASALNSLYGTLAHVGGPALSGILIAAFGLTTTYLIDVCTYAASLLAIWLLDPAPPAPEADRASVRTILEGFRFVRRTPVITGIFLLDSNAMIFGMPSALFPALADRRFHAGAEVVGFLYAAPYAGALLAVLLSGWIRHVRRQGVAVAIAASAWGLAIVGVGLAEKLWLCLLMLAAAGAADSVSATLRSTIVLSVTPEHMLGRVSGMELAQVAATPALGNIEAGILASLTSVRFSIVSGGVACIAGCLVILAAIPALLRYDSRRPRE
jgi:MFS family permease